MVKIDDKSTAARCKITANSGYNPDSAAIIARKQSFNFESFYFNIYSSRNGYIQRFSYNCTQYSRNNLRKTGFFDTNNNIINNCASSVAESSSLGSIRSSITSLGSYVIVVTILTQFIISIIIWFAGIIN